MVVRRATPEDASGIGRVSTAAWKVAYAHILPEVLLAGINPERRTQRTAEHIKSGTPYWVAVEAETVVGFACAGQNRCVEVPAEAELHAIYVDPAHQGSGVGKAMMRDVLAYLKESGFKNLCVFVFKDNMQARGFYERMGACYHDEGVYNVAGTDYPDVSYVWPDLDVLETALA